MSNSNYLSEKIKIKKHLFHFAYYLSTILISIEKLFMNYYLYFLGDFAAQRGNPTSFLNRGIHMFRQV